MSSRHVLLGAAIALLSVVPMFGARQTFLPGPSFVPDGALKGSSLAGWHTLGQAKWQMENGELTGTPGPNGAGGWLVLDRSYQDVGVYTKFMCTGGSEAGILFRIQKTADGGMKGTYAQLSGGDSITYFDVTTDAEGKITERTAPPAPNRRGRPGGNFVRNPFNAYGQAPGVNYPYLQPDSDLVANDWNDAEFLFAGTGLRATQNNGKQNGTTVDTADGYGPIAIYVGGSGEAQFKDVAYKNLNSRYRAPDTTSPNFRKQTLNDFYYSWGAAAADFNHDGVLDVVSGPYIYYGPDYTKSSEIYLAQTLNPSTEYAVKDWMEFAADFTGDGWPDVLTCKFIDADMGCYLYVNPKGENRRWDVYRVLDKFDSEIAVVRDVDGPGKPAVVYAADGYVRYAEPDPANPTGPWVIRNVSERGFGAAHGIGVGDINGDGRMDIVNPYGWWEHPAAGSDPNAPWKYHPEVWGRYSRGDRMGGSVMAVYDVNGDGLADVVTVLDAHGWGMAWYEQKRDGTFAEHMIMDTPNTKNAGGVVFTQAHGDTFADINGDGIPDFIVGKRYWSHLDTNTDPDPYGTPVLYWYETVRDKKAPGGAKFVPHLIDNRSGSGSDVLAVDLKHNGKIDVVTATRFGTFIFWNQFAAKGKAPSAAAVK